MEDAFRKRAPKHCAQIRRLVARGREQAAAGAHAALVTEATLAEVGKRRELSLPRPQWTNVEAVLRELESAPCGAGGVPEGAEQADMRLLAATRKDLLAFLGLLFTLFGSRSDEGCHSVRAVQLLTVLGWTEASERYVPKRPSPCARPSESKARPRRRRGTHRSAAGRFAVRSARARTRC